MKTEFDNPDTYDLGGSCDGEGGTCNAEMERKTSGNGDYVLTSRYEELLGDYKAKLELLSQINSLSG